MMDIKEGLHLWFTIFFDKKSASLTDTVFLTQIISRWQKNADAKNV